MLDPPSGSTAKATQRVRSRELPLRNRLGQLLGTARLTLHRVLLAIETHHAGIVVGPVLPNFRSAPGGGSPGTRQRARTAYAEPLRKRLETCLLSSESIFIKVAETHDAASMQCESIPT